MGQPNTPIEDSARLLSGRGPRHLANAFEAYLRILSIGLILCLSHRPQTNGKLDWFHQMGKPPAAPIEWITEGLQPSLGCCDGCARPKSESRFSPNVTLRLGPCH
jgi:hypothetical protein